MKPPLADPAADPGLEPDPARQRRRALAAGLVGKKVSLSTSDFHHLVGRLVEIREDDRLRLFVNNQEVLVRAASVARIHEADPALAEYIK
jgi:hypothetical protein